MNRGIGFYMKVDLRKKCKAVNLILKILINKGTLIFPYRGYDVPNCRFYALLGS